MHSVDPTRPAAAPRVAGLVLAAGAGSRYGRPKALVAEANGDPWLVRAALALEAGGCDPILVVLGASAGEAESLLRAAADRFERPDRVRVVHAADWAAGLSASLAAGLHRLQHAENDTVTAVALVPVDVPDLSAAAVLRLVDAATPDTLRQAHFGGRPGHPVVIGRNHWAKLSRSLAGDTGARPYLVANGVEAVPCDDLGTGDDVDMPAAE
ncbi:NTP transferase domain-containing protein [Cryobacterium sp. SO2]|uniref:nucleotidyltransferase family protein n=1 Tax=Cryobacterium sp. SO2 TaxID=1897060 RepID=UPI00223C9E6F|nr:NTP transferase domain-containing protein [Cryobacterium sp. SO2]WEO78924.1 NTP transferase domain-containing protein [Cryobacterium sp. SO2]